MELNGITTKPNGASQAGYIKESTDRAFKADVIDASLEAPVLVDFWGPGAVPAAS